MRRPYPTGLVPARFYADALKYYQKSKDKVGIERVKRKYSKIKNKIKLAEVDLPLDQEVLSEIQEINDQWIQGIVSRNPEEILNYLSSANDFMFLPNNKILDDIKASKIETFLDYINEIKIDINNNISQAVGRGSKSISWNDYNFYMNFQGIPFLQKLYLQVLKNHALNINDVINYLNEHSWLGQEFEYPDSSGENIRYSWIPMVIPPIHEFLFQFSVQDLDQQVEYNLISSIDSLAVKFEGIFRDLIKIAGGSTSVNKRGNMQEQRGCLIKAASFLFY